MPSRNVSKRRTRTRVGGTKRRAPTRTVRRRKAVFRPQRLIRTGFPVTNMIKLKYVEGFSLDPTVGVASMYVFRANSIYDPNYTGTGHQPMNRDLWSTLYKRYTVVGAKINLRVFSSTTSASYGMMAGIILNETGTISDLTPSTLMEQGLIKYKMSHAYPAQNSANGISVNKTFSAKKFFNITNVSDNKDVGADQGANPTRTAKFVCLISATPGSTIDLPTMHCVATIEYIVMYAEPLEQAAS